MKEQFKPSTESPDLSIEEGFNLQVAHDRDREILDKRKQRIQQVDQYLDAVTLPDFDFASHEKGKKQMEVLAEAPVHTATKEMLSGSAAGVNETSIVTFKTPEGEVKAVMKPEHGERYIGKSGKEMIYDYRTGGYREVEGGKYNHEDAALAREWSSPKFQKEFAQAWADEHGVSLEDAETALKGLTQAEVFNSRYDIEPRTMAAREAVFYRMSLLTGLAKVPPTVERVQTKMLEDEKMGTVVAQTSASLQVFAESTDKKNPSRHVTNEELKTLLMEDPSDWEKKFPGMNMENFKKQMTELACMDWLMGSMDRHDRNFMIDPVSGDIHAIDNGLHSGRGRTKDGGVLKVGSNAPTKGKKLLNQDNDPTFNMRALRSVPLEILANNPEMQLSPDAKLRLAKLYNAFKGGVPYDEQRPELGSAEKLAIEKMYMTMFPDSKTEALNQLNGFKQRLRLLVEKGRPPETTPKHMYPIGFFAMQNATS